MSYEETINVFGINYPTEDHERMVKLLSIKEDDLVLDIGGGDNPFKRADYVVDIDLFEGKMRNGKSIEFLENKSYIVADIHKLPFKDKAFDFVFCSHVLEHVADPIQACKEIMRVGKRGYIETPRKWTEIFAGHPTHLWLVDLIDNTLVFEKRPFIESPFLNFMLPMIWNNPELYNRALWSYRNITCVQLYWEEKFNFIVKDVKGYDINDLEQVAYSHYSFAKNVLQFGAPPEYGIYHAERAVQLKPNNNRYRDLLSEYKKLIKKYK